MAAGLALAWMDTRPGFDDTGLLVGLLVLASIGVVVLGGTPSTGRAVVLGLLVGAPTPIAEIPNGGQVASIAALIFALTATLIGSFILRVMGRDT